MRDNGTGDLGMDPTVCYSFEMATLTWDPLSTTHDKDKVSTCGPTVERTKENSTKISAMDEVLSSLLMVLFMKVTLPWEKGTGMASTTSQMEAPMKENGKMANMMDMGEYYYRARGFSAARNPIESIFLTLASCVVSQRVHLE